MGTGTPTVTVSGISAANAILKKIGIKQYTYDQETPNMVRIVEKPYPRAKLFEGYSAEIRELMEQAWRCQLCEDPACSHNCAIPGIMRRIVVGNLYGAAKLAHRFTAEKNQDGSQKETWETMEKNCVLCSKNQEPVAIGHIIESIFK